jgi:DNA topoisomerase IB
MFNLSTVRARYLYQAIFLRLSSQFATSHARVWYPTLHKVYYAAAAQLEHGNTNFETAIQQHKQEITGIVKKTSERVLSYFGTMTFTRFKEAQSKSIAVPSVKGMENVYWERVTQWAQWHAARRVVDISDTTRTMLKIELARGMREGLSNSDIAKAIRAKDETINKIRAIRIARTETHTAANEATNEAVKSTGYRHERIWVSARDERVRGVDPRDVFDHWDANGQKRDMDTPFDVSGEKLDYPGDPKGKAGNIINCRCVLVYNTIDTSQGQPSREGPSRSMEPMEPIAPIDEPVGAWNPVDNSRAGELAIRNQFGIRQTHLWTYKKEKDKLKIVNGLGSELSRLDRSFEGLTNSYRSRIKSLQPMNGKFVSRDYNAVTASDKGINGVYFYNEKLLRVAISSEGKIHSSAIQIGEWTTATGKLDILRHEIGHGIEGALKGGSEAWENLITKAGNGLYQKGLAKLSKGVSKYSATNGSELFAESFATYTSPYYAASKKKLPKVIETFFSERIPRRKGVKIPSAGVTKKVKPASKKPSTVIGDLSSCIIKRKKCVFNFGRIEQKKATKTCGDYVRLSDGKWILKNQEVKGQELERLKAMKLPPSWRSVTATVNRKAKIQAIGMDAAGRWQYKYSMEAVEAAAKKKFDRVKLFSKDMSLIKKKVSEDIEKGLPQAYLLRLENKTAIRIGTDTDFKAKKKAYGLTTLQNEHVTIKGNKIILDFVAKEGIPAHYELVDKTIADFLQKRKTTTKVGDKLFPDVPSKKLNDYLKTISGKNYTIKDFRTYHGTRIAYDNLKEFTGMTLTDKKKKEIVKMVSETVSDFLANTPTMARKSYIDPRVWDLIGGI